MLAEGRAPRVSLAAGPLFLSPRGRGGGRAPVRDPRNIEENRPCQGRAKGGVLGSLGTRSRWRCGHRWQRPHSDGPVW